MWGALISAGIGVAGQLYAKESAKKQKEAGDDAMAETMRAIEAGEYDMDLTLSPEMVSATQEQKKSFDEMVKASADRGLQQLGTVGAGLRTGDARMAAIMPKTLQSLADQQRAVEVQALQGKAQADAALAQVSQGLTTQSETANYNLATQMAMGNYASAQQAASAGFVGEQQAVQNMSAVPMSLYSAYASGGGFGNPKSTGSDQTILDLQERIKVLEGNP